MKRISPEASIRFPKCHECCIAAFEEGGVIQVCHLHPVMERRAGLGRSKCCPGSKRKRDGGYPLAFELRMLDTFRKGSREWGMASSEANVRTQDSCSGDEGEL